MTKPRVFAAVVANYRASKMFGQPSHVVQVRAFAEVPSRAAFARALIDAGLEARSPAAVSAWLRDYGFESGNADEIAAAHAHPGCVFVTPLNARSQQRLYLKWPADA